MQNIQLKKVLMMFIVLFVTATASFSQSAEIKGNLNLKEGIAIQGYDAVAYFTEQAAIKGAATFTHVWQGANWQFSSQKNLDLFEANPERYAPQYGGFCAYGASKGYKANTDPNAWTIVGDKLYLNYNLKVKGAWITDTTARIQLADKYWMTQL